jgi:hypothetical protein
MSSRKQDVTGPPAAAPQAGVGPLPRRERPNHAAIVSALGGPHVVGFDARAFEAIQPVEVQLQ